MAIEIVRLLSSEEIIGDVTPTEKGVKIDKPMQLHIAPGKKPGEINIHLAPYLPFGKKNEVELKESIIVTVYEPADELAERYRKHFSPIITASQGLISKI